MPRRIDHSSTTRVRRPDAAQPPAAARKSDGTPNSSPGAHGADLEPDLPATDLAAFSGSAPNRRTVGGTPATITDKHSVFGAMAASKARPTATTSGASAPPRGEPVALEAKVNISSGAVAEDAPRYYYVTASTVAEARPGQASDRAGISAFLQPSGCMGYRGPIGPYGPLGSLGPIGDRPWNASAYTGHVDRSEHRDDLSGPLGPFGPLGKDGPVGDIYADAAVFDLNAFTAQLRGGGLVSVLGPTGPLGAFGPLGPLGPVGAHLHERDRMGRYLDSSGAVQRSVDVLYDKDSGETRRYDLVEDYREDFAKKMQDNDTSFMVRGYISGREEDAFSFTSREEQLVSVVVVPEKELDDFDFEILDRDDKVICASSQGSSVDWAELRVPAGQKLKVKVKLHGSAHWLSKDYRLIVTGSTESLKEPGVTGAHQRDWTPADGS